MKLKNVKDMTLTQIWDKIKKPFNFAWRAGVIVIAVGMICGLFSEFMGWLWCYVEGDSYETEYLSDNVRARYYTDGTCRLYERYGNKKLSKKLKFVDSCPMADDTLTSYQDLNGKWGFLSTLSGKIVIPATYTNVWDFNEGLAAVADETNKVGYIDITGTLVIPMQDVDHRSGYYSFKNGISIMEAPVTGLKGAINKDGKWVIPMVHKDVFYPDNSGFIKVYDGYHWGLYDSDGNEVFPVEYDEIYYDLAQEGVFALKDGIKQLVKASGEVVEPFIVDRILPLSYVVHYISESECEYATHPYLVDYNVDIYHGVLDTRTGKVVVPAIYDKLEMISKNMIKASLGLENIESVIYDVKGKKISK